MEHTAPWRHHSTSEEVRAFIMAAGIFVSVLVGAVMLGSMIRREISPWAWRQFPVDSARHGPRDALLSACLYLTFYGALVFLPYCVLRFAFWVSILNGRPANHRVVDESGTKLALFAVALGVGLLLLTFLDSLVAFFRSVPSDVWNGWLLILAVLSSILLILGGIGVLRDQIAKVRVAVPHDSFIVHECSRCHHTWASKAKDLERRWIRDTWHSAESAGGYPLE